MTKKAGLYVGKAGQLAVMSELAFRGYNVSMPEVDVGDDIFALNSNTGVLKRLQVKTATAQTVKSGTKNEAFAVSYSVRWSQVKDAELSIHYVFCAKTKSRWRFLIIERAALTALVSAKHIGTLSESNDAVGIRFVFFRNFEESGHRAATTTDKNAKPLDDYYGNWSAFPELEH